MYFTKTVKISLVLRLNNKILLLSCIFILRIKYYFEADF